MEPNERKMSETIWSLQWRLPAFLIAGPLSYLVLSSHMSKNVHVLKPTQSVLSFPSFLKQTSLLYIKKKRKNKCYFTSQLSVS